MLNLHDSWEWATREERKMLVRTMIQETGCDVETKRILWVKVNPDYEILFRLMDGLQPDAGRRYRIRDHGAKVDIVDIGEETRQMVTEVKIAFPVSHNALTSVEEVRLIDKIAQLELSDLANSIFNSEAERVGRVSQERITK